jgi:NAD(P)-dependent dehydrogenase (short-subunit alcohol dehydrogenase family)
MNTVEPTIPRLLERKVAIVTGGASGIGAGIVRMLASAGVESGVLFDLADPLESCDAPIGWDKIAVDLRDDLSIARAFADARDRLKTVDVLVAAAGIVPAWTGIRDLDPLEWDELFRVNARGVMRSIQEIEPALAPDASIVVIASQNAWRGSSALPAYTASKHAALGLVRSLALELGPRGVRVNAIGPGSVPTDAYVGRLRRREESGGLTVDEALEAERVATPLKRLTSVDDVARATLFLASGLASAVTGHVLPVGAVIP